MHRCALVVLALTAAAPAWAACPVAPGDQGGADLTLVSGDCLEGEYTNVGTFSVAAGQVVSVIGETSVFATAVDIGGDLVGEGTGLSGGIGALAGLDNAVAGVGPGGGGAGDYGPCVHGGGGGGGGHGGGGGRGPSFNGVAFYSSGGTLNGLAWPSPVAAMNMGSGGGGAGSGCDSVGASGGAGGASLYVFADTVHIDGTVAMNGADGFSASDYSGGSGGGAGGGIAIDAVSVTGTGFLVARGGDGGNTVQGIGGLAGGGGGGGGGRIVVSGGGGDLVYATGGGAGGLSQKIAGLLEDNGFPGQGGSTSRIGEPSLSVGGVCPGRASVGIANLPAAGPFLVLGGAALGADVVPSGPCIGTTTGLGGGVKVLASGFVDAGGSALLAPKMKAGSCGKPIQVVDESTCALTNVSLAP